MDMRHDFDVTIEFLRWLYPTGPWMLTAISVDKKQIEARTFDAGDLDEVRAWLELHKKRNLYYSVNQPIEKARSKKKLSKLDVHTVYFLHVDVDPREGEDIPTEQERILKQIESYRVPPSAIIFSGGGYNAVWRLEDPQLVSDPSDDELTLMRATNIERRNWQFEIDFSTPDHCRDISRILRLPGTINWPNEQKIKKGRTTSLSAIVRTTDLRYAFQTFAATPVVSTNSGSSKTAKVSENIQRIEDVSYLGTKYGLSSKLQVMIAQGQDPEEKTPKGRSEILFGVVCEMVRAGVPDAEILGVITDSKFGISESVLDKGASVMRYATRQLSRAKDKAVHPRMVELNDEYAVVENYGGACMIMREEKIDGRSQLSFQRPKEFFNARAASKLRWLNDRGKEIQVNEGKWWFEQPRRRQYSRVVFEPCTEVPGAFNLWRGFAVTPTPGDKHRGFLEHVRENICSGEQQIYDYLMKWIARLFQTPKTQSETAIVLIGSRGAGKSWFCEQLCALLGDHATTVNNIDHLTGKFNSHLSDKVLVVAEEAYHMYERSHESTLKQMITGQRQQIERKGLDLTERPNYLHLIMTSNNTKVVPAGDKERRFLVLRVSESVLQNTEYFGRLDHEMRTGGRASLLHELLTMDLSSFNVRAVPYTEALLDQQLHNLPHELEWLLSKLHSGVWIPNSSAGWCGPIEKEQLYRNYLLYCTELNIRHPMGYRIWHDWFVRAVGDVRSKQLSPIMGQRPMAFVIPPLDTCREKFVQDRAWQNYRWDEVGFDPPEQPQTAMDTTATDAF